MTQGSKQTLLTFLALVLFALVLQFANLRHNPPGFFIDESSIAYNAHLISTTGHDEHNASWPLFFRAFGEFKNPVYVYLLAGVFRVTGSGMLPARGLSAFAGLLTAVLLGLLAAQISRNRTVGLLFGLLCLLTPWLFELSRLVMEVAIYPLVLALFLLAVWHAETKPSWGVAQICSLAAPLALLTYTYSIGRLLAPLLALGLFIFVTRRRLLGIALTCVAYSLTWIPIVIFNKHHPEALTSRFQFITYLSTGSSWFRILRRFTAHFFANLNPWRLFVTESSKTSEIVHIPGWPALLSITALLIVVSVIVLLRNRGINAWWVFIVYGLLASVIPASLTIDDFHMLRLAPLPVFLLLLTVPAFKWLVESSSPRRRIALFVTLFLIIAQAMKFQWGYYRSASSPRRLHTFDADYPAKILPTALSNAGPKPIYIADDSGRPSYIQAYWYATLQGIPIGKFVSLGFDKSAPENAVVITTEERCSRCRVLAESEPYTTYIAVGPPVDAKPLQASDMMAEVSVEKPPELLNADEKTTLKVNVRNLSTTIWLAGERNFSPYHVVVGNHWLDSQGNILINDDGRGWLRQDVRPGELVPVTLNINAPSRPGEYILEIDLLQEGVAWFGSKGSKTWRGRVIVNE